MRTRDPKSLADTNIDLSLFGTFEHEESPLDFLPFGLPAKSAQKIANNPFKLIFRSHINKG